MDLSRQPGRLDHHELLRARQSLLSNRANGRDGTQCSRGGDGNENGLGLRHAASQLFGLHLPLPATARLQDIQLAEVGHGHRSDFATAHLLVRRVYDRFGSKSEKLRVSKCCPLYPLKAGIERTTSQKRNSHDGQNFVLIRMCAARISAVLIYLMQFSS